MLYPLVCKRGTRGTQSKFMWLHWEKKIVTILVYNAMVRDETRSLEAFSVTTNLLYDVTNQPIDSKIYVDNNGTVIPKLSVKTIYTTKSLSIPRVHQPKDLPN